jgi:hypothetical protein
MDLPSPKFCRSTSPHEGDFTSYPNLFIVGFPAPKGILQKIRAIQRNFLWRGAEDKKKWALVAWEKLCWPKNKGGLGLQDPQMTNVAYGEKLWWRWVKDSSVCGPTYGKKNMPLVVPLRTLFVSQVQGRDRPFGI